MDESRLQTRVGGLVLLALLGALVFTVVILPRIEWGKHVRFAVYFQDLGGLRVGAPVMVAGRHVGEIESVDRIAEPPVQLDGGAPDQTPPKVVVRIALRASYAARVHLNSDFFVASQGPLSQRSIEIANRSDLTPARALAAGDRVRGIDPPSMDRVLERAWNQMAIAKRFLDEVAPTAHELGRELRTLMSQLDELSPTTQGYISLVSQTVELFDQFEQLRSQTGGATTVAKTQQVLKQAGQVFAQLRTSADTLDAKLAVLRGPELTRLHAGAQRMTAQVQAAIASVRALTDQVVPVLANIEGAVNMVARGEGSLMRLMTDPEFPEDTKELGKILKRTPWRIVGHPPDAK